MCGILCLLNYNPSVFPFLTIQNEFMRGKRRGPEFSILDDKVAVDTLFGFHRLSINGLDAESNQPLRYKNLTLICNGEIYNYKELYQMMDVEPETGSDCEVILHLFDRFGIDQTLQLLDGVFSFVLCEYNIHEDGIRMYVARDPYGVRPLYQMKPEKTGGTHGFASELKMLIDYPGYKTIDPFPPGHYHTFFRSFHLSSKWVFTKEVKYHSFGFYSILASESQTEYEVLKKIQFYFRQAVQKRVLNTERPIACLLSGGLDSSLVTAMVNEFSSGQVETYSIGLAGSEDLHYARIVADYLGTKHTEIVMTETEYLNSISEVIESIESYDTTTVRASVGNYLVAKWISGISEAKVIFNGDGSDELTGGYLYMKKAPDALEFDRETRRLLTDIHLFDVLRSDKSISSNGLEPRTPFLDRTFVQYYLSIDPSLRFTPEKEGKYLIRKAFSTYQNKSGKPLLPDAILWRKKEAFSDGIMEKKKRVSEMIEDFARSFLEKDGVVKEEKDDTYEKMYYRRVFDEAYPRMRHLVPYYWMPKYVDAVDASAKTLTLYQED
jgi:asparagine synthase (glutamine-hydrolysing)